MSPFSSSSLARSLKRMSATVGSGPWQSSTTISYLCVLGMTRPKNCNTGSCSFASRGIFHHTPLSTQQMILLQPRREAGSRFQERRAPKFLAKVAEEHVAKRSTGFRQRVFLHCARHNTGEGSKPRLRGFSGARRPRKREPLPVWNQRTGTKWCGTRGRAGRCQPSSGCPRYTIDTSVFPYTAEMAGYNRFSGRPRKATPRNW